MESLAELEFFERVKNDTTKRKLSVMTIDPIDLARVYLRYREETSRRRASVSVRDGLLFVEWTPTDARTAQTAEHAIRLWLRSGQTTHPPWPCGRGTNVGEECRNDVEKALEGAGFSLTRPKFITCSVCYPEGNGSHNEQMLCTALEDKDLLLTVLATALLKK